MNKKLLVFLLWIPIVFALTECPRTVNPKDIPCMIISSWHPGGDCSDHNLSIYNESTEVIQNLTWDEYAPRCNVTFNISNIGTYHYNSSLDNGVINVQGDEENMILAITIFLLLINGVVFALPFWVRFSPSEAANYMIKKLVWISALILLWFNTTLFRQLASDWGLGIDNFLIAYWWVFTLGIFAVVLVMCYVMVVGSLKLMKESQLKKRMGDDY